MTVSNHALRHPSWLARLLLVSTVVVMVLASIAIAPAPADAAAYRATANLNLRSGPGTEYPVIGGIPSGATVEVTGEAENGYLPVSYNGVTGYAASSWLTPGDGGGGGTTSGPTGTRYVIDGRLNLRSGPAMSYGVILVMPDGAAVQLTGEVSGSYSKVTYNGTTGWAATQYLSSTGPTAPTPTATPVTPTPTTPAATTVPTNPGAPSIGDTVVGSATVSTGGLSLNMRSGPGTSYGVLRGIPNGARVDLMGDAVSGFLPVRYSGTKGWASAQYLTPGAAATPTATPVTPTPTSTPVTPTPTSTPVTPTPTTPGGVIGSATVATGGLNLYLRSGPSLTASILRSMPNGSPVEVTGAAQGGYTPIRYQGIAGWAASQYLRVSAATPTATPVTPTPSPTPSPTTSPSPTPSPTPTSTAVPTVPGGNPIATAVVSVSGTTLNMRSGPGTTYTVLRGLANGTQVDIMGAAVNGFRPIRYAGASGWAHQDYLIIGGTNPNPTVPSIGNTAVGKATINAAVWKRTGPGTSYSANEYLRTSWKVEIMGDAFNGWTPIRYNGSKGWVPSSYLDPGWGWTIVDQMITTRVIPMTTAPGGGSFVINVGAISVIDITGPASGKYYPVQWYGRLGWVDGTTLIPLDEYVDPGPANEQQAEMIAIVYEFADKWGIPRDQFLRVARCESSLNPNAVSSAGAQGLFQFMPSTWAFTPNGKRGEDPFNPRSSADAAGWMFANGMAHHWMCA